MSAPQDPITVAFADLERTLVAQESGYVALRRLVAARRDAIRTADLDVLKRILDDERAAVTRLGELDRRRTELALGLGRRFGLVAPNASRAAAPPTVQQLLLRAPEDVRVRVTLLVERLRDEITLCRRESSVVRDAAERLAQHVSGLLQSVSAAFATTKTYGRGGRFAAAGALRSIDLRS